MFPMMDQGRVSLELVSAPAEKPVTLAELKNSLRIDSSVITDDTLLNLCIDTAVEQIESLYGLRMVTQTLKLWLDAFPEGNDFLPQYSEANFNAAVLSEIRGQLRSLPLLLAPVQSITHLKTYDEADTAYTMSSSLYTLDTSTKPCRLSLKENAASWPDTVLRPARAIEVQMVCGFGAASAVPSSLKLAVLMYAGAIYDARGCDATMPPAVGQILSKFERVTI